METPVLFHDPTSEPSRAVHWFSLEASIALDIRYVWLSRHEHLSAALLQVNPRHQVPALRHGDFCLSEATAIIRYLAEIGDVGSRWLGASVRERARVNMLLSWYHTNLRTKATLNYLLPVLLTPGYKGWAPPPAESISAARDALHGCLKQLDEFLGDQLFLCGTAPMVPDFVFASELYSLDCDPDRSAYFCSVPRMNAWLERLRDRPAYETSHRAWNVVVPMVKARLAWDARPVTDSSWVADACKRARAGGG